MPRDYKRRPVRECQCGDHAFVACTKGFVAIFDPVDVPLVAAWNWSLLAGRYAARKEPASSGGRAVSMHNAILGISPSDGEGDHCDGNGMNNRRSNLRVASKAQNQMNRHAVVSRSGFKGVVKNKGRWGAGLSVRENGVRTKHWFGTFDTPEEAALAYDCGARELFGEFARTNFPAVLA